MGSKEVKSWEQGMGEILVSDWKLEALKRREQVRRKAEESRFVQITTEYRKHQFQDILFSGWTLDAFKRREDGRRRNETVRTSLAELVRLVDANQ